MWLYFFSVCSCSCMCKSWPWNNCLDICKLTFLILFCINHCLICIMHTQTLDIQKCKDSVLLGMRLVSFHRIWLIHFILFYFSIRNTCKIVLHLPLNQNISKKAFRWTKRVQLFCENFIVLYFTVNTPGNLGQHSTVVSILGCV